MTADRYAHPTMGDLAKGAAEFVAPRTVEDGVNLTNILGDIGELTPFAPAVPFLESRLGLREWDDETIAAMALLGLIPFGGKVAREAGKGIRKTAEAIERIPKGNKGGFIRFDKKWPELTPAEQVATDDYIHVLNHHPRRFEKIARPQKAPEANTFRNSTVEDLVDDAAGNLKLQPKPPKGVRLDAITPEHTGDAGFFRHLRTNYDDVEHQAYQDFKNARKSGKLPRFDDIEYYDDVHFVPKYRTEPYGTQSMTENLKGRLYQELDDTMPGYIAAVEGRGPGQAEYNKMVEEYNRTNGRHYMLDSYDSPIYKMQSELEWIEKKLPTITDDAERAQLQQRSQELRQNLNDWTVELLLGDLD